MSVLSETEARACDSFAGYLHSPLVCRQRPPVPGQPSPHLCSRRSSHGALLTLLLTHPPLRFSLPFFHVSCEPRWILLWLANAFASSKGQLKQLSSAAPSPCAQSLWHICLYLCSSCRRQVTCSMIECLEGLELCQGKAGTSSFHL